MNNKLVSRISLLVALALAISIAAGGQQTQTQIAPSLERLRTHINYLASDKLEGRRTGSEGANLAAEYIAKEFARYGIQRSIGWDTQGMSILEADSPNRYLQKFPYVAGVELGKGNKLSFSLAGNTTNLEVGADWMPLGLSTDAQLEKVPVSLVGFGITSSELKYDDYAGANATGRVAVAFAGTPDGDNPHGQFARYDDVHWKAIAARNAGARALVVIAREENFKDDRLSQLRYDNSAGGAGLPVIVISRAAAAKIFFRHDTVALSSLENAIRGVSLKKLAPPPGWTPERESFSIPIPENLSLSTDLIRREVTASNVVGIVNGFDPVLKNEFIVIGAHYDHLGRGGEGSLAPREGDIHHGADDNASGTAGLLELARMFASSDSPRPRRTIVFIAFSGEEEGLLGSNYYVNHPLKPLENTVAMINMDMIGRMKNNKLIVGGVGTAEGWRNVIDSSAKFWGIGVTPTPPSYGKPLDGALTAKPESSTARTSHSADRNLTTTLDSVRAFDLTLNEDGYGPSDHSSFYAKKIPVLFLWTGTHEDYHKPSDTADKINYEDEAHILSFVERVVRSIDANDARPVYTVAKSESQGRTMGFRVYLGTIPNYADSGDGLLLDGVRDDSPAAKAGIKAGDRIVKLAGREVHNVYDYTYALGEMKAGQEYEVELMRSTERLKLKITPAARK
jgi:aminopeptidase YwaD